MFIIQAAVTIVTAGLAERLFNFGWSPFIWSLVILGSCIALLLIGKYPGLDKSMKIIISILTVATFGCRTYGHWCTNTSTGHTFCRPLHLVHSQRWLHYRFYGLDAPLDASIWHSVWTKEKAFYSKQPLSVKGAFADFNVGYLSAAFIGLLFFLLGALVMFGSGTLFLKTVSNSHPSL